MNIYPTAATSVLNVESAKATSAQIFNNNGVLMEKVELREGNNQINISHYTAGVYILKTNEHTARFIRNKIVVQKSYILKLRKHTISFFYKGGNIFIENGDG